MLGPGYKSRSSMAEAMSYKGWPGVAAESRSLAALRARQIAAGGKKRGTPLGMTRSCFYGQTVRRCGRNFLGVEPRGAGISARASRLRFAIAVTLAIRLRLSRRAASRRRAACRSHLKI